jgi:hypothetical protein
MWSVREASKKEILNLKLKKGVLTTAGNCGKAEDVLEYGY